MADRAEEKANSGDRDSERKTVMTEPEVNDASIAQLISNKIASGVYESTDVVAWAMLRALPLLKAIANSLDGAKKGK